MGHTKILEEALKLQPQERFALVENLLKSLDIPDAAVEDVWVSEAERRLQAYRDGRLGAVPVESVFPER